MDTWENEVEVRAERVPVATNTYVSVNGSNIPVEPGTALPGLVKQMALDAGFGKFRVFLNGQDVKPSEAPAVINEGDRLEIRPYDAAGR